MFQQTKTTKNKKKDTISKIKQSSYKEINVCIYL
jgi:hypothetical protein